MINKRDLAVGSLAIITLLVSSNIMHARKGVGVGTGKIVVEEKLKAGIIYQLPPLTVFNTGDEPSDYGVGVSYHQDQPQLLPPGEWFVFEPSKFTLNPGEAKTVDMRLSIPLKVIPGDYFAYLEAHPITKTGAGETAINIAAAAKIYFTVAPANIFQGIFYRALSFWKINHPWSERVAVGIGITILLIIAKRNLHIEVKSKKGKHKSITGLIDD